MQLPVCSVFVQFLVCSVFVQFLVCHVQPACQDLLLGSFVPSVLCNSCPVCAVCNVTGRPLIPRADAVYTIITHMRSARVLHGISCKMVQTCGGEGFSASVKSLYTMYQCHEHPQLCFKVVYVPFSSYICCKYVQRKRVRGESVLKELHLPPCSNRDCSAGGQARLQEADTALQEACQDSGRRP